MTKGTKRKRGGRAPRGRVDARGEVSVAMQGVPRLRTRRVSALGAKKCGGSGICEHGRHRFSCKECGGAGILSTAVCAIRARTAVG